MFVLVNVDFKFVKEFFVDLFVLMDEGESLVDFTVELFIGINSNKMLFPQLLFFSHNIIKLDLLSSDVGFHTCKLVGQFLPFSDFICEVSGVVSSVDFVLICLLEKIVLSDLEFLNIVPQSIQFVLCSFCLIVLLLKFRDQLNIIIFCLM